MAALLVRVYVCVCLCAYMCVCVCVCVCVTARSPEVTQIARSRPLPRLYPAHPAHPAGAKEEAHTPHPQQEGEGPRRQD
jgi:hypothetical protein